MHTTRCSRLHLAELRLCTFDITARPDESMSCAVARPRRIALLPSRAAHPAPVIAVGFGATTMLGKSVVYYKTPTEVLSLQGQQVRLAGTLVKESVKTEPGTTTFSMTDGKTTMTVVYQGSATTALSTASQPGTQMVAEGSLGTDGVFHSSVLLAKCPSKFQASTTSGGAGNGQ